MITYIRIIESLSVIGLPAVGTKLCRKCDGVSATRWATKNSVNKCRGCTRDKVEPLPVMGPVGYAHVREICDHLAGHAFRYVDDVHLRMTGMPGIKCYLVAIWGPAEGPCFRTLDIRHPHQLSSVRITQPYLWGASAIGGKGDVLPIRRVLWLILVMCGGNQLYGGRFRMRQILAPDVDAARECDSKSELVTSRRNRRTIRVLAKGKFPKRAVCKRNFVQFKIVKQLRPRKDQLLVIGCPRDPPWVAPDGPKSCDQYRRAARRWNGINAELILDSLEQTDIRQLLARMRKSREPFINAPCNMGNLFAFQSLEGKEIDPEGVVGGQKIHECDRLAIRRPTDRRGASHRYAD